MMVNLTMEECGYIGATALFFRRMVNKESVEDIIDDLIELENIGAGSSMLKKIQEILLNGEEDTRHYG